MDRYSERQALWVSALVLCGLMSCLTTGTAIAADAPPPGKSASIPFASRSIRNWTADGEKGIWVQASGNAWYYGAFDFPCQGLDFKLAVRFLNGPMDELDKWGGIETRESGKCRFKSFETSAGPPKKLKSTPAGAAPAEAVPAAPAAPAVPAVPAPSTATPAAS